MTPAAHVVLVHHDQPAWCARSAAAFLAQDGVGSLTVVDSSADRASRRQLMGLLPGVEVIDAGGNVGFGPGANLGLRRWLAGGRGGHVVVAPHDAVPEPGCVRAILDELDRRPSAGLASAEFGSGYELLPVIDKVIGGYYRPSPRGEGWQDVDYPHGTLMVARRATLEQVGLFDERYFAYCEEVDLALRARALGWRSGLVWGAVVRNGRLPSQGLAGYLQVRNTLLLVREHFGPRELRARAILAAWAVTTTALRRHAGAALQARLQARAVADFAGGRFGPPPAAVLSLAASPRRSEGLHAPARKVPSRHSLPG